MEKLIKEYRESLRALRRGNVTPLHRGSMASDTEWAIEYMETGHIPGTKWTVARWSRDKREVSVDPLEMSRYVSNQTPIEAAPEWMIDLLDKLLGILTDRERHAYTLVRGQKFSFEQAGKFMKCSKASVQVYVRRAENKFNLVIRKQTIVKGTFCG